MVNFTLAVTVAYIGIAFVFAYIAKSIESENMFFVAIKIFLYCAAVMILYFMSFILIVAFNFELAMGVI